MSKKILFSFSSLPQGNLEKAEKVELMRWLENNKKIKCCVVNKKTISVDTPQDLVEVLDYLNID